MTDYANVGGKQVLVADIVEWLENRGLVAVPRFATEEMTLAWATVSPAFQGTSAAHSHARDVWNVMIAAANVSLKDVSND